MTATRYLVYFRGTDPKHSGQSIYASTTKEAKEKFARGHEVLLSGYITYHKASAP